MYTGVISVNFNLLGKYNFPNISEFHMFDRTTLQILEELLNILVGIFPNVTVFLEFKFKISRFNTIFVNSRETKQWLSLVNLYRYYGHFDILVFPNYLHCVQKKY